MVTDRIEPPRDDLVVGLDGAIAPDQDGPPLLVSIELDGRDLPFAHEALDQGLHVALALVLPVPLVLPGQFLLGTVAVEVLHRVPVDLVEPDGGAVVGERYRAGQFLRDLVRAGG